MAQTRRLIAAVLAAAFLATSLLGASPADAQATRAQWWGPTGMNEGWHVRVPVVVNNSAMTSVYNATTGYDLSVGDLLTAAGWPSRAGNGSQPASFQLDEKSVRVVEYRALGTGSSLDGVAIGPVPSRLYLGSFGSRRAYDAATQADIHVDWVVPGEFKPNSDRYFYVYLDAVANGPKPPAEPDARGAPLDARYWLGRGTTLYGKASTLVILGAEDDTAFQVEVYANGKPRVLTLGQGADATNVISKGEEVAVSIASTPTLVRVTANRTLLAAGTPSFLAPVTGPIASTDGGLVGTTFVLPAESPGYTVYVPSGSSVVTLDDGTRQPLSPNNPLFVFVSGQTTRFLSATNPVMVQAWPNIQSSPPLVSKAGTPFGAELFGRPYGGQLHTGPGKPPTPQPPCTQGQLMLSNGKTTLYTPDHHAYYWGRDPLYPNDHLYPFISGAVSEKAGEMREAPLTFPTTADRGCPLAFESVASSASDDLGSARIGGFGGGEGAPPTGPVGLTNATDGTVFWPVTIAAPYNGTLVTLASNAGVESRGLDAGGVVEVQASLDAPVKIHATKPIVALQSGGGALFSSVDESLRVKSLGRADYRGYLIDLKPADGAGIPMVSVGAPGKSTTYRLLLRNLARDAAGAPAPDQVQLTTDAVPPGWYANLSEPTVSLAGGAQKIVTLTVTPPPDADEGSRLSLSVHATSMGNPKFSSSVATVTILRVAYGVDAWFDREGGPKQETFTLDPGAAKDVQVVIKNLATVRDSFVVTATTLSSDWSVGIQGLPGALTEVELEPGATTTLTLRVHAPAGGSSQSVLEVSAASVADAAVTSHLVAALRTRADLQIALTVDNKILEALPGTQAAFNFTLHNRGNDSISARWTVQAHLPEGWSPILTKVGAYNLTELSGIPPTSDLNITLLVPVAQNATRGDLETIGLTVETIPQFAGDAVRSESESVRVLVAADHKLVPSGAKSIVEVEPDGTATAFLRLENLGNGEENLSLFPDLLPPNTSVIAPPVLNLAIGENKTMRATLAVSRQMAPAYYPTKMRIVTDDGASIDWDFDVHLPELARIALTTESPTVSVAGQSYDAKVVVENQGNVPLPLPPRFTAPPGWTLAWGASASTGALQPGQAVSTILTLSAPRNATPGAAALEPDPAWATGPGLPWTLRTVDLKANVTIDAGFVAVLLSNGGTGDAVDVDVSIYQAGHRVDTFVVPRIPPGGTARATLALPEKGGPVELKLDESARFGETITQTLNAPAKNAPGAGLLVVLVALAGAGGLLRRGKRGA